VALPPDPVTVTAHLYGLAMSSAGDEPVRVAIEQSWSVETCDPVDVEAWSTDNPARGQCGATALVVHDLLGGELLLAEVRRPDGTRQGVHYWNRLPDGREVDLTCSQFSQEEIVQAPRAVTRPPGPPMRCAPQYELLRARVLALLGTGPLGAVSRDGGPSGAVSIIADD
jgi:hypothetical protein